MTPSTSEVAVCWSSASERCPRASASSRLCASSCSFNSISVGWLLTRALAFVPVERSLRPRVGLFAPLRDKVTSSAQSLVPPSGRPSQGSGLPILTAPHDELAALHLLRSFDHLVGACEQLDRRIEAKRLGGLQIDHQLELCRKLDRQVTRLFALENAIDVGRCASEEVGAIDSIRRQPAVLDHFAERIDHRQAIADRELEEERLMS